LLRYVGFVLSIFLSSPTTGTACATSFVCFFSDLQQYIQTQDEMDIKVQAQHFSGHILIPQISVKQKQLGTPKQVQIMSPIRPQTQD
jgi:hypothetical protein